jgi:hypothetical protein
MKLILALAFILSVNVFLFLGQTATSSLALEYNQPVPNLYNYNGSLMQKFDRGNNTLNESVTSLLPGSGVAVETGGSTFFSDVYGAVRKWFLESTGLNYLIAMVNALPNFLKDIGLPEPLPFALGFFWHVLTIFLVIAFLKGDSGR